MREASIQHHHSLLLEHSFMLNTKIWLLLLWNASWEELIGGIKCNIWTISRTSSLSNNARRLFCLETGCNNGASAGHRGEVKSSQQQQHEEIWTENENKRMACVEKGEGRSIPLIRCKKKKKKWKLLEAVKGKITEFRQKSTYVGRRRYQYFVTGSVQEEESRWIQTDL